MLQAGQMPNSNGHANPVDQGTEHQSINNLFIFFLFLGNNMMEI
jgi:hypothetical protein